MTPEMQHALLDLSTTFHPNPEIIFRKVLTILGELYGGTMAMINLVEGDTIRYRDIVNPHPLFRKQRRLALQSSWCQFSVSAARPVLIQHAGLDPRTADHPAVRLGLTRYLAVPVFTANEIGCGTLCFLDGRSEEPLGDVDIDFLSVLAMRVSAELQREQAIEAHLADERDARMRIEALNQQLRQAGEEKSRFVMGMVHDLCQPLMAMRTTLYLLRSEDDPDERRQAVDLLDNRLATLTSLAEELIDYAQIESREDLRPPQPVDLGALLTERLDEMAPEADALGVRLCRELAGDLGISKTDPTKLARILQNLVTNAIKFTSDQPAVEGTRSRRGGSLAESRERARLGSTARRKGGRSVSVRAYRLDEAAWVLEVEDTGIGIAAAEIPNIFEEFYRGPQTAKREEGANYARGRGLGLAIVRRLCSALEAEIAVRSEPCQGTCFRITFPQAPGQASV